jgi:predicted NAD/FAD-binding protein
MPRQIAVIGSGIAGLASAWLLRKHHAVTLIERNTYIGGHTHTIEVDEEGRSVPVDTGFIVYNTANYPLLTRLFARLGVATQDSDMSFAASIGPGAIEYAGDNLNTLFAQRRNLVNPSHLRMLVDIVRFNRRCTRLLAEADAGRPGFGGLSLGEFLNRERLGTAFRDRYLLPMAAAIWSCPSRTMMDFPAESLARFFHNHGLLQIVNQPLWRTVVDGSHSYVKRLLDDIGRDTVLLDGAQQVRRLEQGVAVTLRSGRVETYDDVVLACHGDEALALLASPTEDEQRILSCFRYQANRTILHTDTALMPRLRRVWASWNYLSRVDGDGTRAVSVTYWMNRLQGLATRRDYLVSLNPLTPPDPAQVILEQTYHHVIFDQAAMDAQQALHRLQGIGGVWYCGSYFGYGFHEDALRSAVDTSTRLGADTGWLTAAEAPMSCSVPAAAPALEPLT